MEKMSFELQEHEKYKGRSKVIDCEEEGLTLEQEFFLLSQTHGIHAAMSEMEHAAYYLRNGIELRTIDQENQIEEIEEELVELRRQYAKINKSIKEDKEAGVPEHVTASDERARAYMLKRGLYLSDRLKGIKGRADAVKKVFDPTFNIEPSIIHYAQAKRYWQGVLDWVLTSEYKITYWLEQGATEAEAKQWYFEMLIRLKKKVQQAWNKRSISSWYYFAINMEICRLLGRKQEFPRLANFALACYKTAAKKGQTWGPPAPPTEPEPMDPEKTYMNEWVLSEDEIIHGIDERGEFRRGR